MATMQKDGRRQEGSEGRRLADELGTLLDGGAWHGPALLELLDGVTAERAAARSRCSGKPRLEPQVARACGHSASTTSEMKLWGGISTA